MTDLEAKAAALAGRLADDAVVGHVEEGYDFSPDIAEPMILAALRSARNEALEEACDKVFMVCATGANAGQIATAIRSLKDKGE